LSLITLLAGIGLILFVVGKFDYSGWKGEGGSAYLYDALGLIQPQDVSFEANAQPRGDWMVLRYRGSAIPGASISGRRFQGGPNRAAILLNPQRFFQTNSTQGAYGNPRARCTTVSIQGRSSNRNEQRRTDSEPDKDDCERGQHWKRRPGVSPMSLAS